jgi:hypothetical protein
MKGCARGILRPLRWKLNVHLSKGERRDRHDDSSTISLVKMPLFC